MALDDRTPPCARLCHIVKWDDFDGYGFNLHAEKGKSGQFIGKVDDGSPSEAAGLRQGDRIIEVNEINIANETHKQVVERIKAFPTETKLLVVDHLADEYFKSSNTPIKGTMPGVRYLKTPERNPATIDDEQDAGSAVAVKSNGNENSAGTSDTQSIGSSGGGGGGSVAHPENGNGSARLDEDNTSTKSSSSGSKEPPPPANGPASLNLSMSAKELRAKLAMRKKYDPKKESLGFKDKFDIVQKL